MNELAKALLMSGGVDKFNTFIGGISNLVTNKYQLASYLNISSSNVIKFKINDNNISALINTSFTIPGYQNPITTKMTRFLYLGTNTIVWGSGNSSINEVNLTELIVPNAVINIGSAAFSGITSLTWGLGRIFTPKVTQIGSTLGDTSAFRQVQNNGKAIFSQNAETANNGNPDGDIQVLISKNWNVTYSQSNEKPQRPTNIQTTQVGGTFAELDQTSFPSHVNDYLGVLAFENGFFLGFFENNLILGLTSETSNNLKIRLVDEFFNISEPAKFSVLTTSIDTIALFQNAVAYWKLGNNNIDLINGYNGTEVGTGITRDGEYVDFGTNGAYIEIPDNDDFSFVDSNGDNTDFVIKTEIKINQLNSSGSGSWLVSKRNLNQAGVSEWQIIFNPSGVLSCNIYSESNSLIFTIPVSLRPTLAINTDYTIVLSKKGNTMRYALNGVVFYSETLDPSFQMFNGSSPVQLGNTSFNPNLNVLKFMGKMKETTILKGQGWDAGEISDNYNNGNGTTIN